MVPDTLINKLSGANITRIKSLIPPQLLVEELPLSLKAAKTILKGRRDAENIIQGKDDRLLFVVGPCSIHDIEAGLEYAKLLIDYANTSKEDLHIIMRVYFENPRTTVGWKGLINDPFINDSFEINKGLHIARKLLLDLNEMGIAAGCEFLYSISSQYIADLVSFGAIGARTTESQVHRELASGISCHVGFKNNTDGSISVAMDAIKAASHSHYFLSVTKQGLSAVVETAGNNACHLILRGSKAGPNYSAKHVKAAADDLVKSKLKPFVMIDCSHGNSSKNHKFQPIVAENIAKQLAKPFETGNNIMGVMIESDLVESRQDVPPEGARNLTYGQSIMDACISWEDTVKTLNVLREGVRARRAARRRADI